MTHSEIMKKINMAYLESIDMKQANLKPHSVKVPGLHVDEAREAIAKDGRFYCEGGHMRGSGKYDLFITPVKTFEQHGICTDEEGWIVVSMDNDDGKGCFPDHEWETT